MRTVIDSILGYLDIEYSIFRPRIHCPYCGRLLHLTLREIGGERIAEFEWRYCPFCRILYWCPSGFGYLPRSPTEITLRRVELKEAEEG